MILDKSVVKIRRGKKVLSPNENNQLEHNSCVVNNGNQTNEDEIYEKVDPDNDVDLIVTKIEKREFFERVRCRFGKPDPLAAKTHFRTHKEAIILTRGDRDIIIKRTTEEVLI